MMFPATRYAVINPRSGLHVGKLLRPRRGTNVWRCSVCGADRPRFGNDGE